jgi:hypothetical protein
VKTRLYRARDALRAFLDEERERKNERRDELDAPASLQSGAA